MGSETFEFTDAGNSETNLTTIPGQKKSGCYVNVVVGFILVLLAVVIAVGVGIIVHFAGGDRDVVCNCGALGTGSSGASADAIKQDCIDMATEGNSDICQKCPSKPGETTTTTEGPPTTHPGPDKVTDGTTPPGPDKVTNGTTPPGPDKVTDGTTPPGPDKVTDGTTTLGPEKVTDVRLPDAVYPLHYNVELQPNMYTTDPSTFTFKGKVKIWVTCKKATSNITLHVNVLEVNPASIRFAPEIPTSGDPVYLDWEKDEARQFLIIKLTKDMMVNRNYTVEMSFDSPLRRDLHGLYLSQYSRGNQTVYLATTQFQPTDARKAFPCFDEPAIKATFNITLVRPSYLISISNTPTIDHSETFTEGGITYVKDVYRETPKMSTYLLAFVVSDFQYISNRTINDILFRTWAATPELVNQTHYALGAGVEILTYFEEYFEIEFPLPKQDMIAIPDLPAGAMENWGLITYRETAMLYEPGVSSETNKERVAVVVSHELAHQWFGNLVTPSWWDDLWLNEGFASFVAYMGVDHIHPEWRMFEKFVTSELQIAFDEDGLISSHPVYIPVFHPDEIKRIFDIISYQKGASIIRMMRHFLGFDTFKRGLTRYLNSRAYDAAFHDDLWDALTTQARVDHKNIDMKAVMDTWTLQMNYPVVTVTRDFNSPGHIHLRQERYLSDPNASDPGKFESPFNYHWTVPVTIASSAYPVFNQTWRDVQWLYKDETFKTIDFGASKLPPYSNHDGWILANVEQNGFYRVNYQLGNWEALCNQLNTNHQVIPIINRAQIINDAWNLAKGGYIGLETALKTVEYLDKEWEYIPWYAARQQLSVFNSILSHTSQYGSFQKFMLNKVNSTYYSYGLDNTGAGHVEVYARSLIAGLACDYGIQDCLDAARASYKAWMANPAKSPIDPNLKSVVYCHGISSGGWEEWNFALKMYKEVNVASEKASLLSALSCSRAPWILNNYLNLILEENSPIRKQDALFVMSSVSQNQLGRHLAWNFFRGNFERLNKYLGASVIVTVTGAFNTEFELQEVKTFRASQEGNLGSGDGAFDQAVENIAGQISWMKKNLPIITEWLKNAGY